MEEKKKSTVLSARVTPEEKERVLELSGRIGIPLGRYLMMLVDQYEGVEINLIPKMRPRAARNRAVLN